jgi:hypothetical protein
MSNTTTPIPTTVSATLVKQELGRLKNNRARRRDGEPTVKSKAPGTTGGLGRADLKRLLAGETVERRFNDKEDGTPGRHILLSVG